MFHLEQQKKKKKKKKKSFILQSLKMNNQIYLLIPGTRQRVKQALPLAQETTQIHETQVLKN